MLKGQGLNVLVHPLTDKSYGDHSRCAVWLGFPVPLRLNTMLRAYRAELYSTPALSPWVVAVRARTISVLMVEPLENQVKPPARVSNDQSLPGRPPNA
jgi:hypothetical protein